jgi:hypothetical protein
VIPDKNHDLFFVLSIEEVLFFVSDIQTSVIIVSGSMALFFIILLKFYCQSGNVFIFAAKFFKTG